MIDLEVPIIIPQNHQNHDRGIPNHFKRMVIESKAKGERLQVIGDHSATT